MKPGPYHHLAALVRQKRDQAMPHPSYLSYTSEKPFAPETIAALQTECQKARAKHPAPPSLAALGEEFGEICRGIEEDHPFREQKNEHLHTAVVALRRFEETMQEKG